ncbi:DMT family transporter [Mesorhizobium sp.]|uniref:DMT family transporter n=1 Tax=Mesorhizobium sp. TaxID=1871066 RepID=UPI0025F963DA|nr:DMT family transporter [Mesorhizobium sp.]
MSPIYFLIAFAAGVAISVQAAINSQLAGDFGGNSIAAAFFSFASGTVVLGLISMAEGGLPGALAALPSEPWWHLIGGALGAGALFSTVLLAPRIGLANLLALVIAGQLLSSLGIDHLGLFNVTPRPATAIKMIGALIMLGGLVLTLFGDRLAALLLTRSA